jgi:hypothetical protein
MSTTTRHLLLPALAASLLGSAPLHAAEATPAPAAENPANVKAEAPVEPYQLKNRSTFNSPPDAARAPFWPIGWVPRGKGTTVATAQAAPKIALDEKMFRVTSILLGSGTTPSLAVINNRAYSEGEFIKMPRAAAAVAAVTGKPVAPATRIRVQRITDGSVVLQREDQTITLALQRPELAQRKAEEPLLEEER